MALYHHHPRSCSALAILVLFVSLLSLLINCSYLVSAFPAGSGTCNASAASIYSQTGQHPVTDLLGFYLDFPSQYTPGEVYNITIRNSGKNSSINYLGGFIMYATDHNGTRQGTFTPIPGVATIDMWNAVEATQLDSSIPTFTCTANNSSPGSTLTHENGGKKPVGLQITWLAPAVDCGILTWQGMVEFSNVRFYIQILPPWPMCSLSTNTSSACTKFDPSTLPTGVLPSPNPGTNLPDGLQPLTQNACSPYEPVAAAALPAGFCASAFAINLSRPRGIFVAGRDVFVAEAGGVIGRISGISLLRDINNDGVIDMNSEYFRIWDQLSLTHGVYVYNEYVYASSPTTVWRATLNAQDHTQPVDMGQVVVVVRDIPEFHHTTRTLLVSPDGQWLYVSIGSGSNVDLDDSRSRIIRYSLTAPLPSGGYEWNGYSSAVVAFAVGLRNEVGLAFDQNGTIWGVMNADDELNRTDLGGYAIHNNNPAERLDKLTESNMNKWYGYPYCWSVDSLSPYSAGEQLSWGGSMRDFYLDGNHTDAWCAANALRPNYALQAHTAPLGLVFYNGQGKYAFPSIFSNVIFIAEHGSWDADVPRGYKVIGVTTDGHGNVVNNSAVDFFAYQGPGDISSVWPHKPVDVKVGANGELFVSSDGPSDDSSGSIFVIRYLNNPSNYAVKHSNKWHWMSFLCALSLMISALW